ncbi:MAG: acyl carrier protein [Actinomycetota bacterium]|nr:acyl carrier protein [Actinomycetota bacterium]
MLAEHGKLAVDAHALDADADTYRAGMTSHASVNVMLALEDAFDVEFPERMLNKRTFASVSAIRAAVAELTSGAA